MRIVPTVLATLALVLPAFDAAHAQVARVLRIDGAAMVDVVGQSRRILGIGEQLPENAVVVVAKESFVMLEFRDQTRVTLRPNTVFKVEAYADETPESVRFGLAKGGLRAVSGAVAKTRPEVVRINTTSAWIGVRGTEFDVRLCERDCESEERAAAPTGRTLATAAARVVEIDGMAVATGTTLPTRMLTPGAMIYERDSIATAPNAYVAIAFSDGSRASIGSNSVLAIQQYRFNEARPEQNSAQIRLFEGGVRIMTGAISRRKPESYRIDTAIGPVDPRGTLFDTFCTGACVDPKSNARAEMLRMKEQAERAVARVNAEAGVAASASSASPLLRSPDVKDGLVVHTVDGLVLVGGEGQRVEVPKGATAAFSEPGAAARFAKQTFAYIVQDRAPRPELVTVDPGLFDQQKGQSYEPGLYVWVRDGAITLNPQDAAQTLSAADPVRLAAAAGVPSDAGLLLRSGTGPVVVLAGQAAFITPKFVTLLPNIPTFMRLDTTPLPTRASVPVSLPFFQARDGSTVGACTPP